jgi:hypothetical protein
MSQLSDIIELIRTTNEVYFITAPERVRAVFILVDDLVELSLKTYLYHYTKNQRELCKKDLEANGLVQNDAHKTVLENYFNGRTDINNLAQRLGQNGAPALASLQTRLNAFGDLQHWSINKPETRKDFDDVVNEVKRLQPTNIPLTDLLDKAFQRHSLRNKLYHDHHSTGWSIKDEKCLEAMCELFDLLNMLFPDFLVEVKRKPTVSCQIGVLRLKFAAHQGRNEVAQPYLDALSAIKKDHRYDVEPRSVEHSLVHTVSDRFFRALREEFTNKIAELQSRVNRIGQMKVVKAEQRAEQADKQRLMGILQQQLNDINTLLGIP